jgi:hypothetical protein
VRYEDLQTEAERDVWRAELQAMAGSPQAEFWASHAVERHRECYSGPLENARIRRKTMKVIRVPANGAELVERCMSAGRAAVGFGSPEYKTLAARGRMLARGVAESFATLALQIAVGTNAAAELLAMSKQGTRNRSVHFRTAHPSVADKARAFAEKLVVEWAVETERAA